MKIRSRALRVLVYAVAFLVLSATLAVTWLRWESSLPRDDWFDERQGRIESIASETSVSASGQHAESVQLESDSGLGVFFRVVRESNIAAPLPVLLVIGGHRTGSDAVRLFGDVRDRAVVGVDYPYDGPEKLAGMIPLAKAIPRIRQGFLDTTPAVSLILDWLVGQAWVDESRIIVVGVSLGVPFAATAAARDERVAALVLVHGAADNRLWIEAQLPRRLKAEFLHYPLATILHWLAYGPVLDTTRHVAEVSPRPVLIVGAREDERMPAGQTELLFDAARNPKLLRWTEGKHVQPNRPEIVEKLLHIAEEELPFLVP